MSNSDKREVKQIKENYIEVSESRIKYTIEKYKKGQPFSWVISASFSCFVSFIVAFATYPNEHPVKWIFLSIAIISAILFLIFGVLSLYRRKVGHGSSEWFLREIKDENYYGRAYLAPKTKRKIAFNIVNCLLIVLIPASILILVLGLNNWNIIGKEWAPLFWFFLIIGCLFSLFFVTTINAYLAYALFGYEYKTFDY